MQKDKLIDKFVKKDYKDEMEHILEKKLFDETAKGLLLEILYKTETAYKDYEMVKKEVESKEDYIEKILKTVKNDCERIKIIKPSIKQDETLKQRTFYVDKSKKEILCLAIARKLLYSISKISKNEKIVKDKYHILSKTLSDLINVGNNINTVEPLRDFNGWSWTTVSREIESIEYNLIYQNLVILLGNKFLETWVNDKEQIIDYVEVMEELLQNQYGEQLENELMQSLKKLSVLIGMRINKDLKDRIQRDRVETKRQLLKFDNKSKYIEELTVEKNRLKRKVKLIDETINDKRLLESEYVSRNAELPLEKKIFSMRVLKEIMAKEREEIINKLEEVNNLLKPKNFIAKKEELEEKLVYLNYADLPTDNESIKNELIEFQKIFLRCYKIKIEKAESKKEIIDLIYLYRYYNLVPFDIGEKVCNIGKIEKELDNVGKQLVRKAIDNKVIAEIALDEELNYKIMKKVFQIRTICLEELYIKITKEKDIFFVQIFDEKAFEEKSQLNAEDKLSKKFFKHFNKKIKLFL